MRRKHSRALQLRLIPNDDPPRERATRPAAREHTPTPHADLVGRSFFDGLSNVAVTGVCQLNPAQVWVEREMDGRRWSISAAIVRHITKRERRKARRIA